MLSEIERFVNWARRRNPQARTHKDYQYDLNQFVAVLGERPLNGVTFQDIDHFVQAQLAREDGPSRRDAEALESFALAGAGLTREGSGPDGA